jgi:hypothetical protein
VSGGAITNAVLFCLGRIPRVTGRGRIIEDATSDYSNLNRYGLLRRSQVFGRKVDTLIGINLGELRLQMAPVRYDECSADQLAPLGPRVLVGVDHIPTRWLVQLMQPRWLGIGATTHWGAMTSFHEGDLSVRAVCAPSKRSYRRANSDGGICVVLVRPAARSAVRSERCGRIVTATRTTGLPDSISAGVDLEGAGRAARRLPSLRSTRWCPRSLGVQMFWCPGRLQEGYPRFRKRLLRCNE